MQAHTAAICKYCRVSYEQGACERFRADAFYFRGLEQRGIKLNRAQIEAVRNVDGSLLILAGAGTGKTSVLVSRTGYLLNVRDIPPQNILLMTFTRKAADEMRERIALLPGIDQSACKASRGPDIPFLFPPNIAACRISAGNAGK